MDWAFLKKRFVEVGRGRPATFTSPTVVLEIQPEFVLGARLEGPARQSGRVRRMEVRELESPPLESQPNRPNIPNQADFERPLREILGALGNGNGRLGLLVPDGIVRVAPLSFETLPDRQPDAEALVRWRMRELLPYPPEEARISFQVLRRGTDSVELLAIAARSSVLSQYESAIEGLSGAPLLILPATVALLPLVPDGDEAAELLVHVCSSSVAAVLLAGGRPRMWRNREMGANTAEEAAREVGREAARIVASARDRLGMDLAKVWLCARPAATPELVAELARAVAKPVEVLTPDADLAPFLAADGREAFERYGATVAGLISNSRQKR